MISALDAARIAREHYGLECAAHALAGEYDLNFRLKTNQNTFLLKIAAANSDRELLEYQNAVMNHIASRAPQLESQHVIANVAGELISEISLEGETRLVRLLSYAPGRTLAATKPHTRELLESLGECIAEMDLALEGFAHPLASRPYKWNLVQAEVMMPLLEQIDSDSRRTIAEKHLNRFSSDLKSRIAKLPAGVIHSDANDYNVIVIRTGFDARVSSVIDFGDAVLSPIICDLAIALAYTMLRKPDPVASAAHVVRGYHRVRPLSELELEVLYSLVLTRLAVSVCNSANEKRLRPDDAYAVISEAPAWALLEHLEKIHENLATGIFRNACNLEPIPNAIPVREWLTEHQAKFGRIVLISALPARIWACPTRLIRQRSSPNACSIKCLKNTLGLVLDVTSSRASFTPTMISWFWARTAPNAAPCTWRMIIFSRLANRCSRRLLEPFTVFKTTPQNSISVRVLFSSIRFRTVVRRSRFTRSMDI
jgi:Ser/Thr protein kinase RdoA (MazF antagonist)